MSGVLDPLTLPLQGTRLIEASAGTGKTWTIAALFLRLVLGHGDGPGRALAPGEVLVMTFTRAATRELSDRIRSRLVQAAAVMRGDEAADARDTFLQSLVAAHPAGDARNTAAWRLAMAAEAMDDAAVHTIDAWCQRMLREHAFDSGSLFDEELLPDPAALLAEAARDYWRQQVYPLDDDALATVLDRWPTVDRLRADVAPLQDLDLPADAGQGTLAGLLAGLGAQRTTALAALKAGWDGHAQALRDWLDAQLARSDCPFKKTSIQPRFYGPWLDTLRDWALGPSQELPDIGKGRERLTPQGLADALAAGRSLPALPPQIGQLAQLFTALDALPAPGAALRLHAAAQVAQRLAQLKRQAGGFGFIDLLRRLDRALDPDHNGARAQQLRARILQQYPVALVDEFQDTSPLQLRIFHRLYGMDDAGGQGRALLLIGDPKQSIYGFRGADIYSYLQARAATAGRHHALGTNHRSTQALVAAVNGLFERAEARPGAGAFALRGAGGDNGLPFWPVAAQGRPEHLQAGGAELPPLTLALDGRLHDARLLTRTLAACAAERIVTLLNDPGCGFVQPGQPLRRLRPADVAVLVRNRGEAKAMRSALRRRGVASVYLSDKDSVLASAEAHDLLRLLRAVAQPRDLRLARAALATSLLGLDLAQLQALVDSDEAFDTQAERLQQLHAVWQQQGVLAMVRRALHSFDLPARWLAQPDGERRLTNVLHLAELLQAAAAQLDGEAALLRWLAAELDDSGGATAADEQVLRLESDADLVQVVTVHKSKGLEYPLVFLPFAALFRSADGTLMLPDAQGRLQLVLQPGDAQRQQAEDERLREDLRLLYVALTRARHALWVGAAALKLGRSAGCRWHDSALGRLLSGPAERTPQQLCDDVAALHGVQGIVVQAVPDVLPTTALHPRGAPPPLLERPPYAGSFERHWAISSYSALVRAAERGRADAGDQAWPALARRVRDDEEPAAPTSDDTRPPAPVGEPWHRFPRGALPGQFLHNQLEWLAAEGFALDTSAPLQQALRQRCEQQGWGHRADDVLAWLQRVCRTPLPPLGGAALQDLGPTLPEMEFWYPSDGLQTAEVDRLCRQHLLPGHERPPLAERMLRGLLMGFADLCFQHDGRCWVLDHKSNALGAGDVAYTGHAMGQAVLAHRYDVQAALYQLALHRLLRVRLGAAYRPAQHLGGTLFLFLRGVAGPAAGCCLLPAVPALLQALDAMLPTPPEPLR